MSVGSSTFDIIEETWELVANVEAVEGLRSRRLEASLPGNVEGHLAADAEGGRHLLIELDSSASFSADRESRGVQLRRRQLTDGGVLRTYADLVCEAPHLFPHFSVICAEVIDYLREVPLRPDRAIHRILNQWRELLARAPGSVSERAIVGLFGELDFLLELVRINPGAAPSWTGPGGAIHDFVSGPVAVEVKASLASTEPRVRIHGERQLYVTEGVLFLQWDRLQRDPDGLGIFGLVEEIVQAGGDREFIWRALGRAGISRDMEEELGEHRFRVTERRRYRVDESFPRITPDSFEGDAVPVGVSGIDYTVELAQAEELDQATWVGVVRRLAEGPR